VGLTGAVVEVTAAGKIHPFFEHPRIPLKAIHYQLDQAQLDRQQSATRLKQSTRPFTSSAAPGKATRRPAPKPPDRYSPFFYPVFFKILASAC